MVIKTIVLFTVLSEEASNVFVQRLLETCGEDPAREGLVKTPHRFYKAFLELTQGYRQNLEEIVNGALFESPNSEPISVKNIPFFSLCEHHLLPFFGHCNITYVPDKKVIGLSKIYRIVDMFSKRLQLQERLTQQIGSALQAVTQAKAVFVEMSGQHLCVAMRGVQKTQSEMRTVFHYGDIAILQVNENKASELILKIVSKEIPLRIGCYEEEKRRTTPVQVTIEWQPECCFACQTDQLQDTVCYDQLIQFLNQQCFQKTYQLIEFACNDIFQTVRKFFDEKHILSKIRVRLVKKLQHPLLGDSECTLSDF